MITRNRVLKKRAKQKASWASTSQKRNPLLPLKYPEGMPSWMQKGSHYEIRPPNTESWIGRRIELTVEMSEDPIDFTFPDSTRYLISYGLGIDNDPTNPLEELDSSEGAFYSNSWQETVDELNKRGGLQ